MNVDATNVIQFGNGLAHLTGVKVQWRDGSPRTDGDTVWLDNRCPNSRLEFDAKCGIAGHEIAHVWFNTAKYLTKKRLAEKIARAYPNGRWVIHCEAENVSKAKPRERITKVFKSEPDANLWIQAEINAGKLKHNATDYKVVPSLTWAAHECLNVVVDIFDERRMEHIIPAMPELFRTSNLLAGLQWNRPLDDNKPKKKRWQAEAKWRAACLIGMMSVRLQQKNDNNFWMDDFYEYDMRSMRHRINLHYPKAQQIRRLLNTCTEKKTSSHKRSSMNWTVIERRANALFKIIKDDIKEQDEQSVLVEILVKMKGEQGDGAGKPQGEGEDEDGKGGGEERSPMQILIELGEMELADPNSKIHDRSAGRGRGGYGGTHFDYATYNQSKAQIAQAAEVMLATYDSMKLKRHDQTGRKLSKQWHRVYTDQKMFVNPQHSDGERLNLALLLDKSGSMTGDYPHATAICKAFAEELTNHGANVKLWLFDDSTTEMDWQHLDHPHQMGGGTNGAPAFRLSKQWLANQRMGRKMVIAITDGCLHDRSLAARQYFDGTKKGIEYLLIGLDIPRKTLVQGWPLGIRAITIESQHIGLLADRLIQNVELH